MTLEDVLKGSKISKYDPKTGIYWVWAGGYVILGFNSKGKEIVSTMFNPVKDAITKEEARKKIDYLMRRGWKAIADYATDPNFYRYAKRRIRRKKK